MNAYDRTIQHKSGSKYFPLSPSPWNYTIPYCEFKFFNCLQCFHWKQLTGLRDLLLMIAGRKGRLGRWHLIQNIKINITSNVRWTWYIPDTICWEAFTFVIFSSRNPCALANHDRHQIEDFCKIHNPVQKHPGHEKQGKNWGTGTEQRRLRRSRSWHVKMTLAEKLGKSKPTGVNSIDSALISKSRWTPWLGKIIKWGDAGGSV